MKKTLLMILAIITIFLIGCNNTQIVKSEKYDSFAKCLTEKEATMYGTEWCSHCKNQKKAFSNSFQYVNYVDCDLYKEECIAAGVKGYPTWEINGNLYSGEQSLEKLASLSECNI